METPRDLRSLRTPTLARRFFLAAALVLLGPPRLSPAWAQAVDAAPLGEADVIRLARTRAPAAALADATDQLAEAHERAAAALPNPSLSWAREAVRSGPTAGQGSEETFAAALPIDLTRPRARRALAGSASAWMRAEGARARTDGILAAVLAYYDVALAARHVEVLARSLEHLDEAARVLRHREAAGAASGYESTRLALAGELSRSHLAEARGTLEAAQVQLAALLGVAPASLRISTELTLMSAPAEAALATDRGEPRAAVQQARASLRLAGQAEARAGWAWLPAVELGGGLKRAQDLGADRGYGYVVGVSLSIPLFDHGQALRAEAAAQRTLASARVAALTRTLDADAQQALATLRAAREELARFEAQTAGQVDALLVAAQRGYREGARTIVELLDAQRAQAEVAERQLSLLGAAKRAEARLRAAAGDLR